MGTLFINWNKTTSLTEAGIGASNNEKSGDGIGIYINNSGMSFILVGYVL